MIHVLRGLGCGVPPPAGEVDGPYTAVAAHGLRAQWHYDWRWYLAGAKGFVPMVWRPVWTEVRKARAYLMRHGDIAFLGNEPERKDQTFTLPIVYARAAKYWRRNVKTPIAGPGIWWGLPEGKTYLTHLVHLANTTQGRTILPDWWAIHLYPWHAQQFADFVTEFRQWMVDAGVVRPFVISELGCSDQNPKVCIAVLRAGHALYQQERLYDTGRADPLMAVGWYSARERPGGPFPWCDLLTGAGRYTDIGRVFAEL